MNKNFPRIITLLREEKNLSQRQVANDLGISQPLLSHYEKGIRECSLDFVVKVADYYNVSCDFLLGRTANRSGGKIVIADIPDEDDSIIASDKPFMTAINKKLVVNTLNIIFDQLEKLNNKGLITECSTYLMSSVYIVFRAIYSSNPKNPRGLFSVADHIYKGKIHSLQILSESNIDNLSQGLPIVEYKGLEKNNNSELSPEIIKEKYSRLSSSLFNLIQNTEEKMNPRISSEAIANPLSTHQK